VAAAEQARWDGLYVWDHVVFDKREFAGKPFGDPWLLLTAAALATSQLRLGTVITPVTRRRPRQLARQVATLDVLSNGRVIFGAGLEGPIEDEYGSFCEPCVVPDLHAVPRPHPTPARLGATSISAVTRTNCSDGRRAGDGLPGSRSSALTIAFTVSKAADRHCLVPLPG
jgi:hypothetical protein